MKRWLFLLTVLSLLLILVPACGDGDEEETPAPTATATLAPTTTATPVPTATSTPTPAGPVKLGVIIPYSGPAAMTGLLCDQIIDVVQMQLKEQGGILGGREVVFVKGDDKNAVAQSVAEAKRLVVDENVTGLLLGGTGTAPATAVAAVAEEYKTPFIPFGKVVDEYKMKYTVSMLSHANVMNRMGKFETEFLKPKKIAYLARDSEDFRIQMDGMIEAGVKLSGVREIWKAAGIDIVYEQYFPPETIDFTPFLTKLKYANPDVAVVNVATSEHAITINKQIGELGGWGNIKYVCSSEASSDPAALKYPSAIGSYIAVQWLSGSSDPGKKAFEDAFVKKHGRLPNPAQVYFYNPIWTMLKAIEMAGTDDPVKVAQALRSGKLEWDSPSGRIKMGSNGIAQLDLSMAQVQEGGKLVQVWP